MVGYVKRQWRRAKKWAKKRYTGKGSLQRIVKDVSMLKSVINSELKYNDYSGSGNMAVGSAGGWSSVNSLNTVTQGAGSTNRDGSQIRIKSIQVKGNLERIAGNHRVRVMILLDKNPLINGALGTVAPPSAVFRDPTDLNSLREWDGVAQNRFRILYSRTFDVDADKLQSTFDIYKKVNISTAWASASASSVDIIKNRLLLIMMSDNTTATDITYSYEARITFRDN